jgi:hypothetical protein
VSEGIVQLFLNLGTRRGLWSASSPGRLYPRERPGTHSTGGWEGPGAGLDRCGKSRPNGIRSPDRINRVVMEILTPSYKVVLMVKKNKYFNKSETPEISIF